MKIALLGYGRMGKEIEKHAKKRNHEISFILDKQFQEGKISDADSEIIKFSGVTLTPFFFISFISSRSDHGSITTPLPRIEIFPFLTIPEGNNLNLKTFFSITRVCPALWPP